VIKNNNLLRFVKVLFIFLFFSSFVNSVFAEVKIDDSTSVDSQKTEVVKDLQIDDNSKISENVEINNQENLKTSETSKSENDENSSVNDKLSEKNENSEKNNKKNNDKSNKSETKKAKSSSTITILSAQKTEYSKSEIGADVIVLTGDVKVKVELDGAGTIIYADKVSYERKRQRLFAEGNVILERLSGSTVTERLTATSVLFNAETQEGVFSEGRVAQTNSDMFKLDSNSSLVVDSDIFGRDDSGVIGFKNGTLTFCDAEDPHWKIDASRIWLLPGNEFAFVNARFFVGSLLTLWLPFFYYPKDEMIFNPVIGTDDRKGYFLHTSTYLVGRKPLESSSGEDDYLSFLKPSKLKKQVREGLFLHNLDEDATGVGSNYLKIMADYYSKLGGFVGIDGVFKPKKVFSNLTFSAMLGFSNTLYRDSGIYTPYNKENDYQITTDKGYLLGLELPFRFYANLNTSLSFSPFSLSLSLPVYSDSFFQADFLTDRSETMDWFALLTGGLTDEDSSSTSTSGISSYSWTANASFSPKISFLNPFVSTFSLSSIKSSISFSSKNNENLTGLDATYSPNRKFFYPSQIVPVGASVNISGTIFSYPFKKKTEKNVTSTEKKESSVSRSTISKISEPEELQNLQKDEQISEDVQNSEEVSIEENSDVAIELTEEEKKHNKDLDSQILSYLSTNAYKTSSSSSLINYSLNYSITPSYDSLITYNSDKINSPDKISFSDENYQSTYYKVTVPAQVSSSLNLFKNIFSLKNTIKFSPQMQEHPFISEEYYNTDSSRNQIILNDYAANQMDVVNTNSLSVKPFANFPLFSSSSISWNSTVKVIDTEFTGTVEEPSWEYKKAKWDEDGISAHTLNLNLAYQGGSNHSQSLSFTSNLPPRLDTYTARYKFSFPFMSFSIETGISEIDSDTNNDGIIDENVKKGVYLETFEFNPLKQSMSLSFFDKKLSISQSFQYNFEEKHPTSFSFSASIWGMSLSYSMNYAIPYILDLNKGWIAQKEKEFLPNAINFSYTVPSKTFLFWKNRISFTPGLSTSIKLDMIRPTNSSFVFSPSITFNISEFFNITFRSTSRNDVIFRYFQGLFNYDVEVPGEKNIIKDLLNSFDFANQENRELSGFKLKSFSIILTHDLHDWDFKSEFSIEPKLITDEIPYRYDFSPYFSISVVWKPMNMFKTQIEDEDGKITLNP
jgi:lipopolysaccharide assembly outer membrane protein LptD (OstA)